MNCRCRKSKVKCSHTGEPPCRGCSRSGNEATCILSGTVISRSTQKRKRRSVTSVSSHPEPGSPTRLRVPPSEEVSRASLDLAEHFASLDYTLFTQAVSVFRAQFPEHGFIHPSDLEGPSEDPTDDEKLRLLAIVAVACRYFEDPVTSRRAAHAMVLTRELQRRVTAPPTLPLIQSFLIMALHEWGDADGYSAWMYAGIAARMAQVYRAVKVEASKSEPRDALDHPVLSEVEIRTIWTYFVYDKLLSCGKQRPAMMKLEDMDVYLPQSDEDFVFGTETKDPITWDELSKNQALRQQSSTPGFHFRIIIRGLYIWSKIHGWIAEGGRRLPGMTDSHNCPWKPTSQWAQLKNELSLWREEQDSKLKYPETRVATHVHFKLGEVFSYINLIYYVSTLFLCREFTPFLPLAETEPRGPIDPPLFREEAPPGWWRQNMHEVFDSAAQISYIMKDLKSVGISLYTPFTSVCVFSAALMNWYAATFPFMNQFDEQAMRKDLAAENMKDLEGIAKLWRFGQEWVQVADAAQHQHDRVTRNRAHLTNQSREDYPQLEKSINYAPLGAIHTPEGLSHSPRQGTPVQAQPSRIRARPYPPSMREAQALGSTRPSDQATEQLEADLLNLFDTEDTIDDWRLWSFWDDPHLLSWDNSTLFN